MRFNVMSQCVSGSPKEIVEFIKFMNIMSESGKRRNSNGHQNGPLSSMPKMPNSNQGPNDLLRDLGQLFGGMINNESND